MTNTPESRLDRIEVALERLIQIQASFAVTQEQHERRIAQNEEQVQLLTQNLIELRAGQQRQDHILDYLMRRDGERNS